MKIEGDYLIFSGGKRVYANAGIIGINTDYRLAGGYDNYLEFDDMEDGDELTTVEKLEMADYMIELWQSYKKELLK